MKESACCALTSCLMKAPKCAKLDPLFPSIPQGWSSIPSGGLERHEIAPHSGHQGVGLSGAKLSHVILSETSSSFFDRGQVMQVDGPSATGEALWLCLKHKAWLFLSTGPSDPPYAFIRLKETTAAGVKLGWWEVVLRDTNFQEKSVFLAGRKRLTDDTAGPFGDAGRLPLQLCFLLADGRFQLFEALNRRSKGDRRWDMEHPCNTHGTPIQQHGTTHAGGAVVFPRELGNRQLRS
eukprot:g24764.t1